MKIYDVPFDDEELSHWELTQCDVCGVDVRVDAARLKRRRRDDQIELRCPECGDQNTGREIQIGGLDQLADLSDSGLSGAQFELDHHLNPLTDPDDGELDLEAMAYEDQDPLADPLIDSILDEDDDW